MNLHTTALATDGGHSAEPERPVTIHLVRHGQTDWNLERRLQGWTDVPLNAAGIVQAQAVAAALTQRPVRTVISSDLGRARATAQPLLDLKGLKLITDTALRERRYGIVEGLHDAEIERRYPGMLERSWSDPDFAFDGGETRRDTYERAGRYLSALLISPPPSEIVIVSHGGTLRAARGFLEGFPVEEIPPWNFGNGEIVTVAVQHNLPLISE